MNRTASRVTSLVAALALAAPGAAIAQEPGVTLDNGPSSKEYAIPLDAARGQTKTKAPKKKTPAPAPKAVTATPAVTTPQPAATPSKKRAQKPNAKTSTTQTTAAVPSTLPPSDPPATVNSARTSNSDGASPGLVIGGLAVAVLALGALAGLVIRRRRTPIDEF
jgi:uncharacterized membrane protein